MIYIEYEKQKLNPNADPRKLDGGLLSNTHNSTPMNGLVNLHN